MSQPPATEDTGSAVKLPHPFAPREGWGTVVERVGHQPGTPVVHYYVSDHLGSATVIASEAGVQESEMMYFPFGGERWSVGSDPNRYKFTGKERDTKTGLDYFGARYYGSNMGRFLSPDEFTGGPVETFNPGAARSAMLLIWMTRQSHKSSISSDS